ncbi:MAG: phosphoribosylaminoimidazolesuccinocarboxamide synthase [bacterium]|nr:phosphoribosylaminoimidazolesuccinocarboxamide synthase [bacterium]
MISQQTILKNIPKAIKTVDLPELGKKYQGKVRDYYILKDKRIIITTDRQSAFDRILGQIPFKGQVLTGLSKFWFDKTKDIIPNHLISTPDPNVMLVKNCKVIPIEMVVRGYISGVTSTSIWTAYAKGERVIYGIKFKDGLKKNQKLKKPIITPTTKAETGHDERLTEKQILQRRIVTKRIYSQMKKTALQLFERGTKICAKAGIILVDTKYEFGLYDPSADGGKLVLVDEIHTPDSSRFWIKATYKKRFSSGEEPENFDKEFLRLWFKEKGYSGEGKPPKMPPDFIAKVSGRYQSIYEKITGKKFSVNNNISAQTRIKSNLKKQNLLN